jgi:response regulator RpfG family c-di-GMP phosphodiesterase
MSSQDTALGARAAARSHAGEDGVSDRVLFVDDEPNILQALHRKLRNRFEVETATSGEEGLRILRERGPIAVVVSDMRMPQMDGATFLRHARAESPQSVPMILSGHADLELMIAAVNDGNVFRFLTKPCNDETLLRSVNAALEQHKLIQAEKELLERTLSGSIRVLTEVLELSRPEAFNRSARISTYCEALGARLGLENDWQLRLAAMLSHLGCIALPGEVLTQIRSGETVGAEERAIYEDHPRIAARILSQVPRLEGVARIVSGQDDREERHTMASPDEVRAAQILRVAVHLVEGLEAGHSPEEIIARLSGSVSPPVLAALREIDVHAETKTTSVGVEHLRIGMVLDENVVARSGLLLARKGATVSDTMLIRIRNFARGVGVREPIRTLVPARPAGRGLQRLGT